MIKRQKTITAIARCIDIIIFGVSQLLGQRICCYYVCIIHMYVHVCNKLRKKGEIKFIKTLEYTGDCLKNFSADIFDSNKFRLKNCGWNKEASATHNENSAKRNAIKTSFSLIRLPRKGKPPFHTIEQRERLWNVKDL